MLCAEDPDGRLIHTREDKPFLTLNGIQTQSALTQNLAPHMPAIRDLGIDVLRLSPQAHSMGLVVRRFDELRRADSVSTDALHSLDELAPVLESLLADEAGQGRCGLLGDLRQRFS